MESWFNYIISDLVVTAEFEEVDRYYMVAFYDGDNNLFGDVIWVEYMSPAPLPEGIPTKAPTEQHVYQFSFWEDSYFMILGNTNIYSHFHELLRTFTVTFLDGNGSIFAEQVVLYGHDASLPSGTPLKDMDEAEDGNAYRFIGWDGILENITEDTVITAKYEAVRKTIQLHILVMIQISL